MDTQWQSVENNRQQRTLKEKSLGVASEAAVSCSGTDVPVPESGATKDGPGVSLSLSATSSKKGD